jgi:rhodanese-related sulfurtransferase
MVTELYANLLCADVFVGHGFNRAVADAGMTGFSRWQFRRGSSGSAATLCKPNPGWENSPRRRIPIKAPETEITLMKRLALLVLLASAVSFAQQAPTAPKSQAKILTRAEFDALMAKPGSVLLIDVRRPTEIAQNGGFPVYLNIQANDLGKHLAEIPKDMPIVTVSNHANRAGIAADLLASKGFKIVGAIGAQVYESEGGTLIKYPPEKPAAQ